MKKRDLITMTAFALSSATLTVATFLAGPLDAETRASQLTERITTPKLVARGGEIAAAPAQDRQFKAGGHPVFDLQAVNTLDQPAEVTVRIMMNASAPVSPLSRAMPLPTLLWEDVRTLTFQPNEIKSVQLVANTNLPPNSMISVALAEVHAPVQRADARGATAQPAPGQIPTIPDGVVILNVSTMEPKESAACAAVVEPDGVSNLHQQE